ncbi:hypothetical protein CCACVL1_22214 [Corchorus capsularis]|uniref:F-box domain-containing protein n=1 Tax=Corchorus capsularis TaxID=210143 RepID=A0A1R3H0S8_COCAP|nr:hypothetical protein CCACVL1_22214 [Corchorus capsularis]
MDQISELPDEVIVDILSRLTVREAAKTSVLSRRWEHLWKFSTSLNFDEMDRLSNIKTLNKRPSALDPDRDWYINCVNKAIDSHQIPWAEELRVCFDLDKRCSDHIDKWVTSALGKRVKRLELDLRRMSVLDMALKRSERYILSNLGRFEDCSFESLTCLQLNTVEVTGDMLHYFLCNCPLLERLSVQKSQSLIKLKIPANAATSLTLRYLEIRGCHNLEEIDIVAATNLISFKYHGSKIDFHWNHMLPTEASLGAEFGRDLLEAHVEGSSYFSQVQKLTWDYQSFFIYERKTVPQFPKLKQLDWNFRSDSFMDLDHVSKLLKACPFLSKITLKFTADLRMSEKLVVVPRCPLECLEEVEMVGFKGLPAEVVFAMFLVENAKSLKKMTIDTCPPFYKGTPVEFSDSDCHYRQAPRKDAELLIENISSKSRAQVVVL